MQRYIDKTLLYLFATWITINLVSCDTQEEPAPENESAIENINASTQDTVDIAYSYLALGDSYTIGQGIPQSQNWPNQLINELMEVGKVNTEAKIIAQTGWTTNDLLAAIGKENLGKYDLISLQIGVNNQFQGGAFTQFQDEFNELLATSLELADGPTNVFVVSIPDYSVAPFISSNQSQISEELDKYNTFIQQQCSAKGVEFINITPISRNLGSTNGALALDLLHPSAVQYSSWIEEILPVVVKLLND